jgi:prepilin-type N-terminal cleavage/methylation domain-containing protein
MLRTRNRQHGFTLLEVVIAITLMTAVLLILFLGLRLGMNAVRRGNERLEKMQQRFAGTDV